MTRPYIARTIEPVLRAAAKDFPSVVLTGPRQAGKTTVLKRLLARTHEYVSLEALDVRELATRDPRALLRLHEPPVILDEVQQTPHLLTFVQEAIDERREGVDIATTPLSASASRSTPGSTSPTRGRCAASWGFATPCTRCRGRWPAPSSRRRSYRSC